MKHLLTVILSILALVATVTGCDGAHRYDARLVRTDSLMRPDPDSALAIVQAVVRDSLTSDGDRAYRDLLLTQARYRCYVTATSDSDINRALSYYRAHSGEREKLTRAYIYKGAVMKELGHPDSAMLYYKTAEATAAPDDYFNLGYSKMRIGELYQSQLPQDSAGIKRLLEARQCFKMLNDTNYLIVTLGMLGAISGVNCPDSAKSYFEQAIRLAQDYKPSLQYTYKSKLAGVYLHENEIRTANQLAMDVFRNGKDVCYENQFYYYAALSFVRLGLIDSAKYVVSHLPVLSNAIDSMNYYNVMAEIAKAENNHELYGKCVAHSKEITTKLLHIKSGPTVSQSELIINNEQLERKQGVEHSQKRLLWGLVFLLALITALIILKLYYNVKKYEREKAILKQEFDLTLNSWKESLQEENAKHVSTLVGYRLSAIEELYQDIRFRMKDNGRVKKLLLLSSLLEIMNERNELLDVKPSDSFWEKMKLSVNGQFNGIVTYVEKHYPCLTDKDINIFCLLCANVTPQIIKLCVGFLNAKSVSNYKNKLIKNKMGLDMSFNDFIDAYMRGDLP
ncbi:MAG: hypothetical protein IJG42_01790 [Muribaculaceae bacterium]|nr:hypothetical protein [Muribaculaceae bacterium]